MEVKIIEPNEFDRDVAQYICAAAVAGTKRGDRFLIALSGGSTPKAIYTLLGSSPLSEEFPWDKVDFFLGDERFVPLDDPRSNYAMARKALGGQGHHPLHLFPIDLSVATPRESAQAYGKTLTKHLAGKRINLVLLGIGDDGHTASLFPGQSAGLTSDSELCVTVKHPTDGTDRISMSKSLIQSAEKLVYLVKGAGKAAILSEIIEGSKTIETYPARLFSEVADRTVFLVDKDAAGLLTDISKKAGS